MSKKIIVIAGSLLVIAGVSAYWLFRVPAVPDTPLPVSTEAIARGEYLVYAGGCISCHAGTVDGDSLSGGHPVVTAFGTFYAPNISPDPATGIGGWTGREFLLALRHGRRPGGGYYFPVFPFRSYAGLSDQDVLDIGAYLMSCPPVSHVVPAHDKAGWLSAWMMAGWNLIADLQGQETAVPADPVLARGAYLVRHLGHCGECHTPRNRLGIPEQGRDLAGGEVDGKEVEPIDAAALADWSEEDLVLLLLLGLKPDGEYVGGAMADVVEHNTSHLDAGDQAAIAAYLKREQK